jgi:hypothetical protein
MKTTSPASREHVRCSPAAALLSRLALQRSAGAWTRPLGNLPFLLVGGFHACRWFLASWARVLVLTVSANWFAARRAVPGVIEATGWSAAIRTLDGSRATDNRILSCRVIPETHLCFAAKSFGWHREPQSSAEV